MTYFFINIIANSPTTPTMRIVLLEIPEKLPLPNGVLIVPTGPPPPIGRFCVLPVGWE
jgi:hypothetical protein